MNNTIKNIIYIYGVQVIRLFLPILMFPILTSRLSSEQFGLYVYTLAFSSWVTLIVEYGFNISSTRIISRIDGSYDDKLREIEKVVIKTQSSKLILSFFCLIFIPICYYFIPIYDKKIEWIAVMYLIGILTGIVPQYYFQGIEKLKVFSFSEIFSGFVFFILTYYFVSGSDNSLLYILVLVRFLTLLLCLFYINRIGKVNILKFSFIDGIKNIRHEVDIFKFQFITSLYTSLNIVFLGFFVSVVDVAIYGASERVIRSGLSFIGQATNVIFPRMMKLRLSGKINFDRTRLLLLLLFIFLGFLGSILTQLFSPYIIPWLFNNKYNNSIEVVNILSWLIPIIAASNVMAFQYLIADGREKDLNVIVIFGAIFNFIIAYILIINFGYIGMAYSWIILELIITALLFNKIFIQRVK